MPRLDAASLLELSERGAALSPTRRAALLLAAAFPDIPDAVLLGLPLGNRDRLLLGLRAELFGDELAARETCPACGGEYELSLTAEQLGFPGESEPDFSPPAEAELTAAGRRYAVRAVTVADMLAAEAAPDPAAARATLVARAVPDAAPNSLDEAEVAETLEALDPLADIVIQVACPHCGEERELQFDAAAFAWQELAGRAPRILQRRRRAGPRLSLVGAGHIGDALVAPRFLSAGGGLVTRFLEHLANRAQGQAAALMPRAFSMFEPGGETVRDVHEVPLPDSFGEREGAPVEMPVGVDNRSPRSAAPSPDRFASMPPVAPSAAAQPVRRRPDTASPKPRTAAAHAEPRIASPPRDAAAAAIPPSPGRAAKSPAPPIGAAPSPPARPSLQRRVAGTAPPGVPSPEVPSIASVGDKSIPSRAAPARPPADLLAARSQPSARREAEASAPPRPAPDPLAARLDAMAPPPPARPGRSMSPSAPATDIAASAPNFASDRGPRSRGEAGLGCRDGPSAPAALPVSHHPRRGPFRRGGAEGGRDPYRQSRDRTRRRPWLPRLPPFRHPARRRSRSTPSSPGGGGERLQDHRRGDRRAQACPADGGGVGGRRAATSGSARPPPGSAKNRPRASTCSCSGSRPMPGSAMRTCRRTEPTAAGAGGPKRRSTFTTSCPSSAMPRPMFRTGCSAR